MIKENDEMDELIFDYLEGNLTPREREAFEILMSNDKGLMDQMAIWKTAFISEPFYPETHQLEQCLVRSDKRWWSFSLNSFVFLSAMLCFPIHINKNDLPVNDAVQSVIGLLRESTPNAAMVVSITASKTEIHTRVVSNDALPNKETGQDSERIDDAMKELPSSIQILPAVKMQTDFSPLQRPEITLDAPLPQTTMPKSSVLRNYSRSEQRLINRQKRKDQERKDQQQFLKGRVPYVVPLDVNNF